MTKDSRVKICVIILFTIFVLFQLYPLSFNLKDAVHDPGDPLLTTWIIGWMQNQIIHDPGNLIDGNILYPHKKTLAFSELLIPQAVISLPLTLFIKNPLLIHNIIFLFSYIFAAFSMFLLVRYLTKNDFAAVISGMIFAFNAYHMSHTPQIQLLSSGLIPLAFLYLHKYFHNASLKNSLLFSLFFTLQALACIYYGLFFISIMVVIFPLLLLINWRKIKLSFLLKIGWPLGLSGGILVIFSLPYLSLFKNTGFRRTMAIGADLGNYLAPFPRSVFLKGMAHLGTNERYLLPGIIALALVFFLVFNKSKFLKSLPSYVQKISIVLICLFFLSGLLLATKGNFTMSIFSLHMSITQLLTASFFGLAVLIIYLLYHFIAINRKLNGQIQEENWNFLLYITLAFWALLLSFGKTFSFFGRYSIELPLPYTWFYNYVPGFKGIRVPPRYAVFVIFAVSILAGYGLKYLFHKINKPRVKTFLAIVLVLFINLEYLVIPHKMKTLPVGKDIPPTYSWLRDNVQDNAILELPFFSAAGKNSIYMYFSLFHKKKIVNGYSGFLPPAIHYFEGIFKTFPSNMSLDILKFLEVKYVVLHMNMWKEKTRESIMRRIRDIFNDDLKIVEKFEYTFQKPNVLSSIFGDDLIIEVNLEKKEENRKAHLWYKEIPNKEWKITANIRPNTLRFLKDYKMDTRWCTNRPRTRGDFLQLEFLKPRKISKISLNLGDSPTNFGINFIVESSNDGIEWKREERFYYPAELIQSLIRFEKNPIQNIYLNIEETKYLKIIQTHNSRNYWWSVSNLIVYE